MSSGKSFLAITFFILVVPGITNADGPCWKTSQYVETTRGEFLRIGQEIYFSGQWDSNEPAIIKWNEPEKDFEKKKNLPEGFIEFHRFRPTPYCEYPVIDFDNDTVKYHGKLITNVRSGYQKLKKEYLKLKGDGKHSHIIFENGFEQSKDVFIAFGFWLNDSEISWLMICDPDQQWCDFIGNKAACVTSVFHDQTHSKFYFGLVECYLMAECPSYTSPGLMVYNSVSGHSNTIDCKASSILDREILDLEGTSNFLLVASRSGFAAYEYSSQNWYSFEVTLELKEAAHIFPRFFQRPGEYYINPPPEIGFGKFLLTSSHQILKNITVEINNDVFRHFYSVREPVQCAILKKENEDYIKYSDFILELNSKKQKTPKPDHVLLISQFTDFFYLRENCDPAGKPYELFWEYEEFWDEPISYVEKSGCLELTLPFCWVDADLYSIIIMKVSP